VIGRSCRHEREVQQACQSGRWTNDLRRHVAACQSCRGVEHIAALLSSQDAPATGRVAPSILWAKARHRRRARAEALASRILVGGQFVTGVVAVAVLAYLGTAIDGWVNFEASFGRLLPASGVLGGIGLLAVLGVATARLIARESR
jgi:hypothetical protein